jgi:hypothetical protein
VNNELQRLFIFGTLTGQLLYDTIGFAVDWNDAEEYIREFYSRKAKLLNERLSLCAQCGMQGPLGQDGMGIVCQCRLEKEAI